MERTYLSTVPNADRVLRRPVIPASQSSAKLPSNRSAAAPGAIRVREVTSSPSRVPCAQRNSLLRVILYALWSRRSRRASGCPVPQRHERRLRTLRELLIERIRLEKERIGTETLTLSGFPFTVMPMVLVIEQRPRTCRQA